MNKKISFSAKPPSQQNPAEVDAWVNNEKPPSTEPVKRFTFEVPLSLHKRIKMTCAAQDRQMAEVLRELLDKHFPEE
ncbi:MAG: hypothetical protein ACRC8S_13655 [Fimbriiglobus sp.]